MAKINVNIAGIEDATPLVTRLELSDGRKFFALDLGPDVSIILPHFDIHAATYAVAVANALTYAALDMEQALRSQPNDNGQGVA